jgi:hypothetical protein
MVVAFRVFSRGGFELPRTRRRGLSRCPSLGARFIVVRLFFHFSAAVCPLPPSHTRHIRTVHMVISCFSRGTRVALVGLLRRGRPARQGARPLQGLRLRRAHRSATPGFFRLARCVAGRGCRGFPLSAGRQSLPPAPPPRTPASRTHFLIRRGASRPAGCHARGLRPCATRGGRAARPPAPRGAPTRGAVFFIVF